MVRDKYEERELNKKLSTLWKRVEDVSTHVRSQIDYNVHSYSEMTRDIRDIRDYLKKIEKIVDKR